MSANKLSNQPPKGTSDWFPEEYSVRKYIFDTWRRVNRLFGYREYLTPILESADIYRAKSGEDVGGKELLVIEDRGGRELAIRPEMTPSVTRMVSRIYMQEPKPIRLFSIANFWRNESPQRGRNREFWQLNTDIFGSTSLEADLEILEIALEIMLTFQPPERAFILHLNHRHLIDAILQDRIGLQVESITQAMRTLDKFEKLRPEEFRGLLAKQGLGENQVDRIVAFMEAETIADLLAQFPQLEDEKGFQETNQILQTLRDRGYGDWIDFKPSMIRGFDYYDGMIFEVFDNHPDNKRALFGGGRYNSLGLLFGKQDIPALGFAPGDETMRLFLESWELTPKSVTENSAVFLPLLDDSLRSAVAALARRLRVAGLAVEMGLETQSFRKMFDYANKQRFQYVIVLGTNEAEQGVVALKDMVSGDQDTMSQTELIERLGSRVA
ncbi:MAG: histidine--tRNA ligase [Candidatus Promineifilaceae bacterium]